MIPNNFCGLLLLHVFGIYNWIDVCSIVISPFVYFAMFSEILLTGTTFLFTRNCSLMLFSREGEMTAYPGMCLLQSWGRLEVGNTHITCVSGKTQV